MKDLTNFLDNNPRGQKVRNFSENELLNYKNSKLQEIYEFLEKEGKCFYNGRFFSTVLPSDYHDIFDNWGLDGKNCFAFLRSSFGCIEYFFNENFYRFNPHDGSSSANCGNRFSMLMNFVLTNTTNLNIGFCYDLHTKNIQHLPVLKEDEMYTLVPAIPLGGSFETSKIEVVKMNVQLDVLAQLYNHKTTK
jgi:hypothetical protein